MALACDKIVFSYPDTDTAVFQGLSFRMMEPGFNALFGPSGVGKTSLAKIIVGEIDDFSGEVSVGGMNKLLYSYNMERLPDWSSVGRHLEKVTTDSKKNVRDELVEAFGMSQYMGSRFSRLSLGQQNRVNLMRYLLQDFELLIMDESLANVDEMTRERIILLIKAMFPERYFLYISHNVVEVSKFCKEILVFRSPRKRPQALTIHGLDLKEGQSLDRDLQERTMLEVMNAA